VDLSSRTIGPYTVEQRLGVGGMAEVYRAHHGALGVHRAIKVIRPEFASSDDFRARFQREAQSVAQLDHPNIVRVHDFGEADGLYYMVMQYVEGQTLNTIRKQRSAIPQAQAVEWMIAVADALAYAHELGVVHRDIKPDNIMLDERGRVVLMDFGVAKLLTADTAMTQTGVGIGTPAYMAPEQAEGGDITPATDVYAACVVLFELLTGRQPYEADTPIAVLVKAIHDPMPRPRELNPEIDAQLEQILLKGTQKHPADRYTTAGALRNALTEWRAGKSNPEPRAAPAAAEPTAPVAADRPAGRWRRYALLAVVLAVAALAAHTWWPSAGGTPDTPLGATEDVQQATAAPSPSNAGEQSESTTDRVEAKAATPFAPDLGKMWTSTFGDIHWNHFYGDRRNTLRVEQSIWDAPTATYVVTGRWGRRANPNEWGRFEFRFTDACTFSGAYGKRNDAMTSAWTGKCTDQPALRQTRFEPDLSSPWASTYGDIHWGLYYGEPNKTLSVDTQGWDDARGQYYVRGRWGRRHEPSSWGTYEFWFDDACSFSGTFGSLNGPRRSPWSGTCRQPPADLTKPDHLLNVQRQ
jgi:tRNA A-37 threonylcarbamoyl transferase component Bud32